MWFLGLPILTFTKWLKKKEGRCIATISHVFSKRDYAVRSAFILAVGKTIRDCIRALLSNSFVQHCPSTPVPPGFSARQKLFTGLRWAARILTARVSLQNLGFAKPPCILASGHPLSSQGTYTFLPPKAASQRAPVRTPPAPVLAQKPGNSHFRDWRQPAGAGSCLSFSSRFYFTSQTHWGPQ